MEIIEQIGFAHFWGLSPAIDFLESVETAKEGRVNVLLEGTSDLRHILKSVADNCVNPREIKEIYVYVNEKQKESFCRSLLLLQVISTTALSVRERVELYLDIFGNAMVREKTQRYIDSILPTLLNLVAEETKKTRTPLEKIIDFKEVKFKERDDLNDIINSWASKIPFAMEQHRDQRLRYHYKERYDFRRNLIDWDYNMGLKDFASILHFYHYREWRQTGIAFEQRFSSYVVPNRTMGSYLPGKRKLTYENVAVRGYWGDIVVSPFLTMGVECDEEPENEKLFKIANRQHIGHSVEVTEYNLQYWIQMAEELTEYHMVFTDPYRSDKDADKVKKAKEQEAKRMDEKKKDLTIQEEPKEEEEEDEEEEEEVEEQKNEEPEQKKEEEVIDEAKQDEEAKEKKPEAASQPPIDFSGLTQEEIEQKQREYREKKDKEDYLKGTEGAAELLRGFGTLKLKIIPIFEEMSKLSARKKFADFFDVGVLGFIHSGLLKSDEFLRVFKPNATIYAENTHFIVPLKKEDRINYNNQIVQLAEAIGLKHQKDYEKKHHSKFTLKK